MALAFAKSAFAELDSSALLPLARGTRPHSYARRTWPVVSPGPTRLHTRASAQHVPSSLSIRSARTSRTAWCAACRLHRRRRQPRAGRQPRVIPRRRPAHPVHQHHTRSKDASLLRVPGATTRSSLSRSMSVENTRWGKVRGAVEKSPRRRAALHARSLSHVAFAPRRTWRQSSPSWVQRDGAWADKLAS
jgi:hypothetical protein